MFTDGPGAAGSEIRNRGSNPLESARTLLVCAALVFVVALAVYGTDVAKPLFGRNNRGWRSIQTMPQYDRRWLIAKPRCAMPDKRPQLGMGMKEKAEAFVAAGAEIYQVSNTGQDYQDLQENIRDNLE